MNKSPAITVAGYWNYAPTYPIVKSWEGMAVITQYSSIELGLNKNKGLVFGGWSLSGDGKLYPIDIALLDQQTDGTLKVNTTKYISNPETNGTNSIVVSDFNKDGIDDIFLAAFNDGPLAAPRSSTAFISSGTSSFTKLTINDATQSHSAFLTKLYGIDTIVTAGYSVSEPFYQYKSEINNFSINAWGNTKAYIFSSSDQSGTIGGSSATTADFNNDGNYQLIVVDPTITLYPLNANSLSGSPIVIATPYFNNKPQYANYVSAFTFLTHNFRVWTDDFNHDGKLDILVGSGIWDGAIGWQKSKIQMLQNEGSLNFKDMTDILGSVYNENVAPLDFSMQIHDMDNSGINSYSLALTSFQGDQGNYILVNDGTGKLYSALHDEFALWGNQVKDYLKSIKGYVFADNQYPKFISYQNAAGQINFLVEIPSYANNQITFLNFPVTYNLKTDYIKSIVIDDRNSSQLIRSLAGDDFIYDANKSQSATHIDGGLGIDTCFYSGLSSSYTITKTSTGYIVEDNADLYGADTLINIEKLQFSDKSISLSIPINGGEGNDKLKGTANDDNINGNAGNDSISGLAGNDFLDGGVGNDNMIGGLGDDTYYVDSTKDVITERVNEGIDTLVSTITYTLANNVENLTLSGSSSINGIGNLLNNTVIGNSGANLINGGLGNDTLTGGAGNDIFVFNSKLGAINIDTITDFAAGDKIALSKSIFKAFAKDKTISTENLVYGDKAIDSNDYIIYDKASGKLYYDADGAGKGLAVQIAIIGTDTHPTLTAADFTII
jgi:Ca2+-binding RTX toxin-like protein